MDIEQVDPKVLDEGPHEISLEQMVANGDAWVAMAEARAREELDREVDVERVLSDGIAMAVSVATAPLTEERESWGTVAMQLSEALAALRETARLVRPTGCSCCCW